MLLRGTNKFLPFRFETGIVAHNLNHNCHPTCDITAAMICQTYAAGHVSIGGTAQAIHHERN